MLINFFDSFFFRFYLIIQYRWNEMEIQVKSNLNVDSPPSRGFVGVFCAALQITHTFYIHLLSIPFINVIYKIISTVVFFFISLTIVLALCSFCILPLNTDSKKPSTWLIYSEHDKYRTIIKNLFQKVYRFTIMSVFIFFVPVAVPPTHPEGGPAKHWTNYTRAW